MRKMPNRRIIDLGDLKLIEWQGDNPIRSLDDLDKLEEKIGIRIGYYCLDAVLLKIHEKSINEENNESHFNT